jgi:hypothetical protein
MPIRTAATDPTPLAQDRARGWRFSGLIAAAVAYAALEFLLGATVGGFLAGGRAEALPFLAVRPWLLIAAAAAAVAQPLRARLAFYGAALLLGAASETIFLAVVGADDPVAEALRGLVAGALLLAAIDTVLRLGRRFFGRAGVVAGALLMLTVLLLPGALRPYEAMTVGHRETAPRPDRPELMLMTALPIIWGEGGAFDPKSRSAASYRMLQAEHRVRPLDVLDGASLAQGRLLLLAQPRALAPEELVALDEWTRRGGRVLILTDPLLVWPSELPLGDIRRAPAIGFLDPLLTHWGLRLEPDKSRRVDVRHIGSRRLRLAAPGRFRATRPECAVAEAGLLARCRIGEGEAVLFADADLMHDGLWTGEGGAAGRQSRTADNPLFVADRLDALARLRRERIGGDVDWVAPDANVRLALALALLPLLLALAVVASLRRLRRR